MEREWLPEEGEVALEAEQGALAESPGVTRRRQEMQAFAARMEAPPPPPEPTQERPSMLSRLASWRAPAAEAPTAEAPTGRALFCTACGAPVQGPFCGGCGLRAA